MNSEETALCKLAADKAVGEAITHFRSVAMSAHGDTVGLLEAVVDTMAPLAEAGEVNGFNVAMMKRRVEIEQQFVQSLVARYEGDARALECMRSEL